MENGPQTWHYGLVARYWAERLTDGPEVAYFRERIARHGQPALDAGCGTGRLLIPFLRAGLDADGCDVSADMLAHCRERAEREGLSPRLYQQALHALDLPRAYRTIVICGALGIGVSRQQDLAALRRCYRHLHPGGTLLVDLHLPYEDAREWQLWRRDGRDELPEAWPGALGAAPPADGSDYELHSRILAFDPIEQRVTREMRALQWRDGQLVADNVYTLWENLYFRNEFRQMLEQAGFEIEAVQGGYTGTDAGPEHDVFVFIARRPG
jgi:SAM-dependent methyltransferase